MDFIWPPRLRCFLLPSSSQEAFHGFRKCEGSIAYRAFLRFHEIINVKTLDRSRNAATTFPADRRTVRAVRRLRLHVVQCVALSYIAETATTWRAVVNLLRGALQAEDFMGRTGGLAVCLDPTFRCWHAICEVLDAKDQGVISFQSKERVMLEIEPYNHDTNGDPAAVYTTEVEIAIADQLRHRLEERYFPPSAPSVPSRMRSSESY